MQYISTAKISPSVSPTKACTGSFADDGGLYMPERIPTLPQAFFRNFSEMSLRELAYVISTSFFGDDVDGATLKGIIDKSLNFPVPVRRITDRIFAVELFHGPTLTCKDFGTRFMARLLRALLPTDRRLHIIVSTSGNTGSAVANGFSGIKNVDVYVLFPKNKLTRNQENEFATLGDNVHAIEVQGTIDDCKALENELLKRPDLFGNGEVITANSINISRIIPQMFYVFHSVAQVLAELSNQTSSAPLPPLALAMPCGNLGNLIASIISQRMGLPISNIIASCNENDALHRYLITGRYNARPVVPSVAHALDAGCNPFNMPRINHLCGGDIDSLHPMVQSSSCDDVEICATINKVLDQYDYLIDPHTAVAWNAMEDFLADHPEHVGLVFATAHPAKSLDAMTTITGRTTELPLQLTRFMGRPRRITKLPPTITAFKRYTTTLQR